ncbi:transposase [Desulfosporosinus sp. OT]|uniref:transposase n=1 Tax=Desulfosporosinus sp. OT TaxID=913865 RepID=UPI0002239C86|nr:transposase [Desulfosporosinus sp. OT]EGW40878.1 transposase IS3/IS911 family domain protein [Desulfosporosinus sp. OT]
MMKMMPPQNQAVSEIARETGLSEATLHQWRKQARTKGMAVSFRCSSPNSIVPAGARAVV